MHASTTSPGAHAREERRPRRSGLSTVLVACAFLFIVAFLLLKEHRLHLLGWLPWLLLLACPLLHLFHGGHGRPGAPATGRPEGHDHGDEP
jgi:hypothetical protein